MVKKTWLLVLSVVLLFLSYCQDQSDKLPILKGSYLDQTPPGLIAEMFAPGIASTNLHDDMGPAFSPDGNEVFFRTAGKPYGIITTMKQVNGIWSKPDLAFWSGQYPDGFVYFSQDGKKLYFGSRRPLSGTGEPQKRSSIWEVDRNDNGYGTPRNLGLMFDTEDQAEYMASVSANNNFYINRRVTVDGNVTFDLYRCQLTNGKFTEPQKIDLHVDPKFMSFGGAVDPEEKYMIIYIRNKEDSFGSDDLYVSFRQADGSWGVPINLGENINSAASEAWPRISPDGKYLFFASWRYTGESYSETLVTYDEMMAKKSGPGYGWGADIYWVSTNAVMRLKQTTQK